MQQKEIGIGMVGTGGIYSEFKCQFRLSFIETLGGELLFRIMEYLAGPN